jgi:hypothetical protein
VEQYLGAVKSEKSRMEHCLFFKKLIPARAEGPNPPMENSVLHTKQLIADRLYQWDPQFDAIPYV